ncbi:MAG: alternative ribosome rescue aminoacyl-tRNA hydrolase ArfB [Planctomycetota bacterium]
MREPLVVDGRVTVPAAELEVRTMRASGPGGQHVNKVETAVELRYEVATSVALTEQDRRRIVAQLGSRMSESGRVLSVRASSHRSQRRNLEEARERLRGLLAEALRPRKTRRATRPTLGSKRRRLAAKKRRSDVKKQRGKRDFDG